VLLTYVGINVADPHHFDADPTYHFDADPNYHFDADPDADFYLMRIRILIFFI
jgi:hypothetical protein